MKINLRAVYYAIKVYIYKAFRENFMAMQTHCLVNIILYLFTTVKLHSVNNGESIMLSFGGVKNIVVMFPANYVRIVKF